MSTVKFNRIANEAGDGVNVAGLGKIEDAGKNICTAWVVFDGTTTPPTIIDNFNVASVVRLSTGIYTVNFSEPMADINYAIGLGAEPAGTGLNPYVINFGTRTVNGVNIVITQGTTYVNISSICAQILGGKA